VVHVADASVDDSSRVPWAAHPGGAELAVDKDNVADFHFP
jgi:hypothetical protein